MQFKQDLNERAYRIKSYKYHHDLAKNVGAHRAEWAETVYSINTNSLGFKDKTNRQIPLKIDKKRLIFIGDSFTEGFCLRYHTPCFKIQKKLFPKGCGAEKNPKEKSFHRRRPALLNNNQSRSQTLTSY